MESKSQVSKFLINVTEWGENWVVYFICNDKSNHAIHLSRIITSARNLDNRHTWTEICVCYRSCLAHAAAKTELHLLPAEALVPTVHPSTKQNINMSAWFERHVTWIWRASMSELISSKQNCTFYNSYICLTGGGCPYGGCGAIPGGGCWICWLNSSCCCCSSNWRCSWIDSSVLSSSVRCIVADICCIWCISDGSFKIFCTFLMHNDIFF